VEALADGFTSRSNRTVLRGNVRLLDSTNRLTCDLLTLKSATPEDPEETATAERNVVVEQGTRRVWADRAVHTKSTQTVVFSGRPRWNIDQREGRAETLILDLKNNVAHAGKDAYLKIPLAAGGQRLDWLPRPGVQESSAVGAGQAIEIQADDLEIRSLLATFTGHVRANELPAGDAQQRLTCGDLAIRFTSPSNRVERLEARGDVVVEQGTRGLTNGSAAWQRFSCDVLTAQVRPETGLLHSATAQGHVVIEQDLLRATGSDAGYAADAGTLELTGRPQLTTPQFVITEAEVLVWSPASNTYVARGTYRMQLYPEARDQPGPFKVKKNQSARLP
jgi:lipopolysaccharide export system protein LptA